MIKGAGEKMAAKLTFRLRVILMAIPITLFILIVIGFIFRDSLFSRLHTSDKDKSIAVLSFKDLSVNHDQEYLGDGVATELINSLAQTSDLKVISRNSSFQFKSKNEDPKVVGTTLGVATILEGSIQKTRDHLKITAQLIKASSGVVLWAKTFDGRPNMLFEIQTEIVNAVIESLDVSFSNNHSSIQRNEEVHNLVLQGKNLIGKGDKNNFEKGLNYLDQALKIDSTDADLWATLAESLYIWAFRYEPNVADSCLKAVNRAIAINNAIAAPHITKGRFLRDFRHDWEGAIREFKIAESFEPGNAELFKSRAQLEGNLGNFQNFIEFAQRAVELDPISDYWGTLAVAFASAGRFDEAESAMKKLLELRPDKRIAHTVLGNIYLIQGNVEEALQEVNKEQESGWRHYGLALVNHARNNEQDSYSNLNSLLTDKYATQFAFELGEIYSFRGESDKAFEWLEKAYQLKDGALGRMKRSYFLNPLHDDPRWKILLEKMDLPE